MRIVRTISYTGSVHFHVVSCVRRRPSHKHIPHEFAFAYVQCAAEYRWYRCDSKIDTGDVCAADTGITGGTGATAKLIQVIQVQLIPAGACIGCTFCKRNDFIIILLRVHMADSLQCFMADYKQNTYSTVP